jgi:hypothetical protein
MLSKNSTVFEPVLVRLWRVVEVFPPVFSFQWLSLPVFVPLGRPSWRLDDCLKHTPYQIMNDSSRVFFNYVSILDLAHTRKPGSI